MHPHPSASCARAGDQSTRENRGRPQETPSCSHPHANTNPDLHPYSSREMPVLILRCDTSGELCPPGRWLSCRPGSLGVCHALVPYYSVLTSSSDLKLPAAGARCLCAGTVLGSLTGVLCRIEWSRLMVKCKGCGYGILYSELVDCSVCESPHLLVKAVQVQGKVCFPHVIIASVRCGDSPAIVPVWYIVKSIRTVANSYTRLNLPLIHLV
jgi:hypothetical protein